MQSSSAREAEPVAPSESRSSSTATGFDPSDFRPIARAVADAFSARLHVANVGPDDDFFSIGGGMISATAVSRKLEKALGRPVSPALIHHARTPRRLGEALEGEMQAQTSHLVDLQPEGDEPEVFCMPEVYGRPMSFITLADRLAPFQPVVGLAFGPAGAELMERRSIEVLSEAYVAAILERRPSGPFRIAGYSFGGAFAQDVARRLHDMGHDVSLVLIDAQNRAAPVRPIGIALWAVRSFAESWASHGPRRAAADSKRRSKELWSFLFGRREVVLPGWIPVSDRGLSEAHIEAWRRHVPSSFHGRTLIVVCRKQNGFAAFRNADGMIGWSRVLRGPVRRIEADVGHQDVVRDGYADALAAEMRAFFSVD